MPRRRLRLNCSSDEENDQNQPQQLDNELPHQDPGVPRQTTTPPNPNPNQSEPVPISDDDFVDVSESLTPPSPPLPVSVTPPPPPISLAPMETSGSPIGDVLLRMGLKLRTEWLESCIHGLQGSVPGFSSFDNTEKAKLCFKQFLISDMNYSGGGVLPERVESMHLVDLAGPFVLQVDEIVNISRPLKDRYKEARSGIDRCLKLSMTDGVQRVFGMEYRPIKCLEALAPAGLKVVLRNVHVRHGLLMLVPEVLEVLGGVAEELDEARRRLVYEVNKPPRGKRTTTGVLPSLATRATLAAWPPRGGNGVEQANTSTLQPAVLHQSNERGTTIIPPSNNPIRRTGTTPVPFRNDTILPPSHDPIQRTGATPIPFRNDTTLPPSHDPIHRTGATPIPFRNDTILPPSNDPIQRTGATPIPFRNDTILPPRNDPIQRTGATSIPFRNDTIQRTPEEPNVPVSGRNSVPYPLSDIALDVQEMHIDRVPPISRGSNVFNSNSAAASTVKDTHMVDVVEHPLILSGDREVPFTYLASLSAKRAAMKEKATPVQGRIKCFLTGVKGFQYKRRTKYELQCYVDDGSLISEILIDHNVVQRGIGHSPEEVTSALTSLDKNVVNGMKETMKQFQIFLVNFEGTMLVEINKSCPLPVAVEMSQGCPASDAWLLLRRMKSSGTSAQTPIQQTVDYVDLSP